LSELSLLLLVILVLVVVVVVVVVIVVVVVVVHDKWGTVTTAWRVFRWMEERPAVWTVASNVLHKRTPVKGWSSTTLKGGRGANNSSSYKMAVLRKGYVCLWPGLILWYNLNNGKGI